MRVDSAKRLVPRWSRVNHHPKRRFASESEIAQDSVSPRQLYQDTNFQSIWSTTSSPIIVSPPRSGVASSFIPETSVPGDESETSSEMYQADVSTSPSSDGLRKPSCLNRPAFHFSRHHGDPLSMKCSKHLQHQNLFCPLKYARARSEIFSQPEMASSNTSKISDKLQALLSSNRDWEPRKDFHHLTGTSSHVRYVIYSLGKSTDLNLRDVVNGIVTPDTTAENHDEKEDRHPVSKMTAPITRGVITSADQEDIRYTLKRPSLSVSKTVSSSASHVPHSLLLGSESALKDEGSERTRKSTSKIRPKKNKRRKLRCLADFEDDSSVEGETFRVPVPSQPLRYALLDGRTVGPDKLPFRSKRIHVPGCTGACGGNGHIGGCVLKLGGKWFPPTAF